MIADCTESLVDKIYSILSKCRDDKNTKINKLNLLFSKILPKIEGDKIIQIGTTFKKQLQKAQCQHQQQRKNKNNSNSNSSSKKNKENNTDTNNSKSNS